jgi:hypothetical protein
MSSHASVSPLILDLLSFFDALSDLKRVTEKAQSFETFDGRRHEVEAVFDDGAGRKAGLQKTDKGYAIVADCHGLTAAQQKTQAQSIQQIVQRYAYRKVVSQLQKDGYSVAEEQKQPDGSIRLVVRKWVP